LVLSDPAIELPTPLLPTYEFVGHVLSKPASPLEPGNLLKWVDGATSAAGFILVSFGTVASLQQDSLNSLMTALGELAPLRAIFKIAHVKPSVEIPDNVMVVDWMPQNDLLGHVGIRAFVTHGGRNSLEEAAFHGVPLVGTNFNFLFLLQHRHQRSLLCGCVHRGAPLL
jgi:UDP:flavonoid glycosyltransferase YjiC (YdhE family)